MSYDTTGPQGPEQHHEHGHGAATLEGPAPVPQPYGGGPTGYGQYPQAPARTPRRGLILGVAGAVLLAALGAGGYFVFLRGDDKAKTPVEALQAIYVAMAQNDCKKAATLVDPEMATEAEVCQQWDAFKADSGTLGRIVSTKTTGPGKAQIVAERAVEGVTDRRIVDVVQSPERGWQVAGGSPCYATEQPEDLGVRHLGTGEVFDGYSSNPPTSGPHAPTATETGVIYDDAQPAGELVHAMEHGAVVVWHNGSLAPEMLEQLKEHVVSVYNEGYKSLIVTPNPGMDTPIALTAWGSLKKCEGFSTDEISSFVETNYGSGYRGPDALFEGWLACLNAGPVPACAE